MSGKSYSLDGEVELFEENPELFNDKGNLKNTVLYLKRYTVYDKNSNVHVLGKLDGKLVNISCPLYKILELAALMIKDAHIQD